MSDGNNQVLYSQAVAMYLHEDRLCLTKIGSFIVLNVGFTGGLKQFNFNGDHGLYFLAMGVLDFLFFFSLLNGRAYLLKRRKSVVTLARLLYGVEDLDVLPVCPCGINENRWEGTWGSTSGFMCVISCVIAVFWIGLAIVYFF